MTLIEEYSFYHEQNDFWRRIEMAFVHAANAILAESANTANHANRVTWANTVKSDPVTNAVNNKVAIMSHWMFSTSLSDADMINVCSSLAPAAA